MEVILHPGCVNGARKNDGCATPSPCKVHWHRCVGSIVYTTCFIVPVVLIWPLCSWILVSMWMTTTNWSMILCKIITTWIIWRWWTLKTPFPNWRELDCLCRVSERRSGQHSSAPRRMAKTCRSSEAQILSRPPHEEALIRRWSDRETPRLSCVKSVDACTTGKCFFTTISEMFMAFPLKSPREHLWVRRIRHCWKPITTT